MDKPILFQGEMVRAILDDRKTQTRRILNDKQWKLVSDIPSEELESLELTGWDISDGSECDGDYSLGDYLFKVPISVGDLLWVRENWRPHGDDGYGGAQHSTCTSPEDIMFEATADEIDLGLFRFYPSIHMFKAFSRITLEVTDVRVQRVQDTSERDAIGEGIEWYSDRMAQGWHSYESRDNPYHIRYFSDPRDSFRTLWDSINATPKPRYAREDGKRVITHYESFPWGGESRTETHRDKPHIITANPWVVAYTFKPIFKNIDQVLRELANGEA